MSLSLYCSVLVISLWCSKLSIVISFTTNPTHFGTVKRQHNTQSSISFYNCNNLKKKCLLRKSQSQQQYGDSIYHNNLSPTYYMSPSNDNDDNEMEQPNNNFDGEALQSLFSKFCDSQGLLTKDKLLNIPSIARLMANEDVLEDELDDIWKAAPKFTLVIKDNDYYDPSSPPNSDCIDVDSFIQVYRDIDDLFEEDDDDDDEADNSNNADNVSNKNSKNSSTRNISVVEETNTEKVMKTNNNLQDTESDDIEEVEPTLEKQEYELILIFQTLSKNNDDVSELISKSALRQWDEIVRLINDDMLSENEFNLLWDRTSRSPGSADMINVDGFLSLNVALDELFEEDDETEDGGGDETLNELKNNVINNDMVKGDDNVPPSVLFSQLANSDNLVGQFELNRWSNLQEILKDGDLLPAEFDSIYEIIPKALGTNDYLDEFGFTSLYNAIDELFEEDDGEEEKKEDEELQEILPESKDQTTSVEVDKTSVTFKPNETEDKANEETLVDEAKNDVINNSMVNGDDVSPSILFSKLANSDNLVGQVELKRWSELQEMIEDGDLLPLEFENMYENIPKAIDTNDYLNESGFTSFYNAIDELFEEDDEEDEKKEDEELQEILPESKDQTTSVEVDKTPSVKPKLMEFLNDINQVYSSEEEFVQDEYLPCGLDCTEQEQKEMDQLIVQLEKETTNRVLLSSDVDDITSEDLVGSWNLLYSSSPMMKFNKGLSGLGGSFPNGKFAGLVQKLTASFFMDVEYIERINVSKPATSSFDVTISGDWELKKSKSLLTGAPSIVLNVEPIKVVWGNTNTRGDHWKSVRAMNLLNVVYLDDDIRVMRGNMNNDLLFIFQRV